MEELIADLEARVTAAMRACCTVLPNTDAPPDYQWGRLQGRYAGLAEALKVVLNYVEHEGEEFEEDESTEAEA